MKTSYLKAIAALTLLVSISCSVDENEKNETVNKNTFKVENNKRLILKDSLTEQK